MSEAERNFRISVTGLGCLGPTTVELRPLTLFVGENNSGKSYLSTVIWALAEIPFGWVAEVLKSAEALEGLKGKWVPLSIGDKVQWLSQDEAQDLTQRLHRAVVARVVRESFRTQTVQGTIALDSQPRAVWLTKTDEPTQKGVTLNRSSDIEIIAADANDTSVWVQWFGANLLATQMGSSHGLSLNPEFGDPDNAILFLPASRTGYMQALPTLLDRLLSQSAQMDFPGSVPRKPDTDGFLPGVTAPTIQFLRLMARPAAEPGDAPHADLAELLEADALRGRLRATGSPGSFVFQPQGSPQALPMGRSSAVVTELAPLIHVLRQRKPPELLIYEEPEAHLHPRLQRRVAQVLVRLVRRGMRVLVTTHSENFAQQINNFLQLGRHPDLAQQLAARTDTTAYGPEDHLKPQEVAAYAFARGAGGLTEVKDLPVGPDGIAMPSFNEELAALATETLALSALLDEREGS